MTNNLWFPLSLASTNCAVNSEHYAPSNHQGEASYTPNTHFFSRTVSLIPLFFLFLSASLTIKLSNLQFEKKQSNAIRSISIVKQSPTNWRYLPQGF